MALGLAATTITGGLFLQPRSADQDVTATPASLHSGGVTPKAASPSPNGSTQTAVAPASEISEITSSDSTPTASESSPQSTTAESASAGAPTSSASDSPAATKSSVSRGSGDRSPLDTPVASTQSSSSAAGSAAPQQVSEGWSGQNRSDVEINGWNIDYFEGFDASLEELGWEHYGWGEPEVGHGAMGVMSNQNTFVRDGELIVRTEYKDGKWYAGGTGTAKTFSASRGRWEVRAKFPKAKGIGYVFLLWPKNQGWPPEIDFAEGRVNGPEIMGTYHWDSDDKQDHKFVDHEDMTGWHTYGVIVEQDHIIFTLDGKEWGRIDQPNITDTQMWFGVQTGAMDPNGKESHTETVDGGVPGDLTPQVSDIQIDYVAHYTRS